MLNFSEGLDMSYASYNIDPRSDFQLQPGLVVAPGGCTGSLDFDEGAVSNFGSATCVHRTAITLNFYLAS